MIPLIKLLPVAWLLAVVTTIATIMAFLLLPLHKTCQEVPTKLNQITFREVLMLRSCLWVMGATATPSAFQHAVLQRTPLQVSRECVVHSLPRTLMDVSPNNTKYMTRTLPMTSLAEDLTNVRAIAALSGLMPMIRCPILMGQISLLNSVQRNEINLNAELFHKTRESSLV